MNTKIFSRCLLAAAVFLLAGAGLCRADEDRWYEIWIEGVRSGWSHETTATEGDHVTTRAEMRLTLGRAGQTTEIRQTTVFIESLGGEAIEASSEQRLGPIPVVARYVFDGDEVRVTSAQGGAERQTTMPRPEGEWLPPAAATRYLKQRLVSGAEEITVRSVDPTSALQVVTVHRNSIAPAEFEALGKTVAGYRAESTTTYGQVRVTSTEWFDAEGTVLRSETSMGALTMEMIASTRDRAMVDAEPAELMISTFVKPDRPISRPRERSRAVFEVGLAEGELSDMPQSAAQVVERTGDASALVTVDLSGSNPAGEVSREDLLAHTTYADGGDGVIVALTGEALERIGEEPRQRAEALRRFVFGHIRTKDLGVAFATASETARSCEGDCSEHGVLLAAMLRAAGIPSRVVAGVVYVDRFAGQRGVFGYHMWTQALLDGDDGPVWVDLDATLDDSTAFDATHIAFAASDLREGDTVSSLASIAPLLGTLEIRVREIR